MVAPYETRKEAFDWLPYWAKVMHDKKMPGLVWVDRIPGSGTWGVFAEKLLPHQSRL
jgi:hypothetical protein